MWQTVAMATADYVFKVQTQRVKLLRRVFEATPMPEASSGSADIPMFFLTELVSINACRSGAKSLLAPLLLQEPPFGIQKV